jgi:hypothetical protein
MRREYRHRRNHSTSYDLQTSFPNGMSVETLKEMEKRMETLGETRRFLSIISCHANNSSVQQILSTDFRNCGPTLPSQPESTLIAGL